MATNNTIPRGFGQGTPDQELQRWLDDARKQGRIQAIEEGLQEQLFAAGPVRMMRLYRKDGESLLITAETAAAYGFRATQLHQTRQQAAPSLFDTQATLF